MSFDKDLSKITSEDGLSMNGRLDLRRMMAAEFGARDQGILNDDGTPAQGTRIGNFAFAEIEDAGEFGTTYSEKAATLSTLIGKYEKRGVSGRDLLEIYDDFSGMPLGEIQSEVNRISAESQNGSGVIDSIETNLKFIPRDSVRLIEADLAARESMQDAGVSDRLNWMFGDKDYRTGWNTSPDMATARYHLREHFDAPSKIEAAYVENLVRNVRAYDAGMLKAPAENISAARSKIEWINRHYMGDNPIPVGAKSQAEVNLAMKNSNNLFMAQGSVFHMAFGHLGRSVGLDERGVRMAADVGGLILEFGGYRQVTRAGISPVSSQTPIWSSQPIGSKLPLYEGANNGPRGRITGDPGVLRKKLMDATNPNYHGREAAEMEIRVAKLLRSNGRSVHFIDDTANSRKKPQLSGPGYSNEFTIDGVQQAEVKHVALGSNFAKHMKKAANQVGEGGVVFVVRPKGSKASLGSMEGVLKFPGSISENKFVPRRFDDNQEIKNVKYILVEEDSLPLLKRK